MKISSLLAASFAFAATLVTSQPTSSNWECVGDITTPVRRFGTDDIECASFNGRDCLWQSDMTACRNIITAQTLNSNVNINALRCGDAHMVQWGGSGYNTDNHWCIRAYRLLTLYPPTTSWTCIAGYATPVRVNYWGDVECMSSNRHDCLWQSSDANCRALISKPPSTIIPLDCNQDHLYEWGMVGYNSAGHWCAETAKILGVKRT